MENREEKKQNNRNLDEKRDLESDDNSTTKEKEFDPNKNVGNKENKS